MKADYIKGHGLIQFFLKRIIIILVVVVLCVFTFMLANAMTNCALICDEGIQERVDYVLGGSTSSESDLEDFFTLRYIQTGSLQELHLLYNDFTINSNYVYSSSIESINVWPGSTTAVLRVSETLERLSGEYIGTSQEALKPPAWVDGTYEVRMVYQDGKWLIDNMILLHVAPEETPSPTPTPSSPVVTVKPVLTPQQNTSNE